MVCERHIYRYCTAPRKPCFPDPCDGSRRNVDRRVRYPRRPWRRCLREEGSGWRGVAVSRFSVIGNASIVHRCSIFAEKMLVEQCCREAGDHCQANRQSDVAHAPLNNVVYPGIGLSVPRHHAPSTVTATLNSVCVTARRNGLRHAAATHTLRAIIALFPSDGGRGQAVRGTACPSSGGTYQDAGATVAWPEAGDVQPSWPGTSTRSVRPKR